MSQNNSLSRRGFLQGGALLAAASTVGFSGMFGVSSAFAADNGDSIPDMLNIAATAEAFAVTHYFRALDATTTKAKFDPKDVAYFQAALESEQAHLDFLMSNGGKPLTTEFYFPVGTFDTTQAFGLVTSIAETVFVGAYLAATRRFAELGQPLLAATAAQVATIEAQHLALVRDTGGLFPNNLALGAPVFYNVSEAVPVVSPLLSGKKGALGDMETAKYKLPSKDDVMKAVGKSMLVAKLDAPFNTLIVPFTSVKAPAMSSATMAATMAATK